MERVLVDTSVWVDYLNNRTNAQVAYFEKSITQFQVCVCPQIVQEVLQGIRNDESHLKAKRYILDLMMLQADPVDAAIGSADLYRFLRKRGVTIRSANDTVVAWFAINFNTVLLHNDKDFEAIRKHLPIRMAYV
jgi:predicted nucleic acid-binding protein